MRKIINIVLIFSLLIPMTLSPVVVNAKTLRTLITELNALEKEYNDTVNQKKLTEKQISSVNATIRNINNETAQLQIEINDLSNEIVVLNSNIDSKDQELKDIVQFVQVSNGESAYLEYAFGAKTFTDFIYRMAISEQLAKYNKNLIDQYNQMIDDNNNKVTEMNQKTVDLAKKQENLAVELGKLGNQLNDLVDVNLSIEEEIKIQRAAIKLYESIGCKLDEDISICGRDKLPPGTAFFRPVTYGYVSGSDGEFGYRKDPVTKKDSYHYAIDLAIPYNMNRTNVPINAAAQGMVISVYDASGQPNGSTCGGSRVFVHHNINGKYYTTMYIHLSKILVKPNQVVDINTQIGIMGGTSSLTPWDRCTTGLHLHFQIATGLYLKDYQTYASFTSRSFNPRNIINFPKTNAVFTDKWTKY